MKSHWTSLLAGVPLLVFAAAVSAETVAYWRFEEGTVGQPAPPPYETDWFVDSSGNGNDMWTFGDVTAPVYDADVPGSQVPQTGAPNTMSLEFTPNFRGRSGRRWLRGSARAGHLAACCFGVGRRSAFFSVPSVASCSFFP